MSATPSDTALGAVIETHPLIEGFTPLSRSRLWRLNEDYWNDRGTAAFFEDAVPYVATNDGSLSAATVTLLVAYATGRDRLAVLEIGPGSGLFARAVIEGYARARARNGTLPRLRYVFADCSNRMLRTLQSHLAPLSELCDMDFLTGGFPAGEALEAALRETFEPGAGAICIGNYAFDSLAATMLVHEGGALHEVEVELRHLAGQEAAPADIRSLIIRTRTGDAPYEGAWAELVLAEPPAAEHLVPVNLGAMETLTHLAGLDGRFSACLINDYSIEPGPTHFEPFQHFASSVALGLNVALMDRFVKEDMGWTVSEPLRSSDHLVSRFYAHGLDKLVQAAFTEAFSLNAARKAHECAAQARNARGQGQKGRALAFYDRALGVEPFSWPLLVEAGEFLLNAMQDRVRAQAMAEAALAVNPFAAEAHTLVGECHFGAGNTHAARKSYEAALSLRTNAARSLLNIAYCDVSEVRLSDALHHLAEAFAADRSGTFTGELLERQREIIERIQSGV